MPVLNPDTAGDVQTFRCDRCAYEGPAWTMVTITAGQYAGRSSGTGNYGCDREGRTYCKACCAARDRESMARGEPISSYVSGDGATIGTWHGEPVARVESCTLVRMYVWSAVYAIRARDAQGRLWVGRGGGRGMYCNLRLAKRQR